jgi:hypothetical protein
VDGAEFTGWDANVTLSWQGAETLPEGAYYVVRVVWDASGNNDEFWTTGKEQSLPENYSGGSGFPDDSYLWSVQAMRCTGTCEAIGDYKTRKQGEPVGDSSEVRQFFWYPGGDGNGPPPPPPPPRGE